MMILVEKWLNGKRNYTAGCILYNQYGKNEEVKRKLLCGESASNLEMLVKAMQALIAPAETVKEEPAEESFRKMPADGDAVCASIHEEWKMYYTAMNMLRGKLQSYGDDNSPETVEASRSLVLNILEQEQHINACWEKLRYYQEKGKLPDEPAEDPFVIPGDAVALGKLIETLKRNIRRNKKKAALDPANPLYPSLVKKYKDRLKQIEDAKKN